MTEQHKVTRASQRAESRPPVIVVRIELTPVAKTQSVAVAGRLGMTQIASLSRLIEWFAGQSEDVQAAVVGRHAPADGNDVAQTILTRMAMRDMSRKA